MRKHVAAISAALLVAGCQGSHGAGAATTGADRSISGSSVVENAVATHIELRDYGMFEPTLTASRASSANALAKPTDYRDAVFGYFDDPDIVSQYTAKERARMLIDRNAFHAWADLDHNGVPESYRTGYFRQREGQVGLFLVAFERGKQLALWTETGPSRDVLWISTRNGFSLWHCNCPETGSVSLAHGRLSVRWDA